MKRKTKGIINFSKEQLKRYKGHLNLRGIDSVGQSAIRDAKVLIVGFTITTHHFKQNKSC